MLQYLLKDILAVNKINIELILNMAKSGIKNH